jgi:hypothetical protein
VYDLETQSEGESYSLQNQNEGQSYSLERWGQGASDDLGVQGEGDVPAENRSQGEWTQHEEVAQAAEPDVYDGPPRKPGCYMRMLSRCPKNPLRSEAWRHDSWAEEHGLDEAGCKRRKHTWDKHCGSQDAELLYVGSQTAMNLAAPPAASALPPHTPPAAPQEAEEGNNPPAVPQEAEEGTGSPAAPQETDESVNLAKAHADAELTSPDVAPHEAEEFFNLAQAHADAVSEEATNLEQGQNDAVSDEAANVEQAHGDAVSDEAANLEQAEAANLAQAHGDTVSDEAISDEAANLEQAHNDAVSDEAANFEQARVDTESDDFLGYPTEPGCYMRMPSGCPKRPMRTVSWRHDAWAEENNLDEESCKERKNTWDTYCGATDAKLVFVPQQ